MATVALYPHPVKNLTITWNGDKELNRLMTAAVVSKRFCKLLLSDPVQAIKHGYNGELFHLTKDEKDMIVSIKAECLSDFASQLVQQNNGHGKDVGHMLS